MNIFNFKKEVKNDAQANVSSVLGSLGGSFRNFKNIMPNVCPLNENIETFSDTSLLGRCINMPIDTALSKGVRIHGDNDVIDNYLNSIGFYKTLTQSLKYINLYGAGALVIDVADDGEEDQSNPLNIRKLRDIKNIIAVPITRITLTGDYYDVYTKEINKRYHKSRVFLIKSRDIIDDNIYNAHGGRLRYLLNAINTYHEAVAYANELLRIKIQSIYKISGIKDLLAMSNDSSKAGQKIVERVSAVALNRNSFNIITIDNEDDFKTIESNLSGVNEIIEQLKSRISALSGIPVAFLFGDSPKGLNNAGEGDNKVFLTLVENVRGLYVEPIIQWIAKLICTFKTIPDFDASSIRIDWEPIIEPSNKEKAEEQQIKATTIMQAVTSMSSAVENGLLTGEEAREYILERLKE